jgi:hypothetical protein
VPAADEVIRLTQRGLRLAQFTVAYNVAEGVLAVSIGLAAGLVSLVGFGLDSAIESVSAVLVGLRLSARLRHGAADPVKERRALRGVAISFFVLAGYVVVEGGRALVSGAEPESSPFGLAILGVSLVVMPVLAVAKRRVGHALGDDRLILTDARQTEICIVLSLSTLAGLGLYALTGASWLDPAAGFVIAVFAIREGIEAWEGELIDLE